MTQIDFKTAAPPSGAVTRIVARLLSGLRARFTHDACAGMSEREFQDVGWGQMDRYSRAASLDKWRNVP